MEQPVDPLPIHEMCQYEKLRESRIKERETAMIESGFFDELLQMKKDFGLVHDSTNKEVNKKQEGETSGKNKNKSKGEKGKEKTKNSKNKVKQRNSDNKQEKDISLEEHDTKNGGKETYEKKEEDKDPWYKNFKIDEWDLHDCLE